MFAVSYRNRSQQGHYNAAYTLNPEEVCQIDGQAGFSSRTHGDGWTISGVVHEDWYYWVNEFDASHPAYGRVWGDFEEVVYAETEEGFNHFFERHTPEGWDYGDI